MNSHKNFINGPDKQVPHRIDFDKKLFKSKNSRKNDS